jgi:hypothetical protein
MEVSLDTADTSAMVKQRKASSFLYEKDLLGLLQAMVQIFLAGAQRQEKTLPVAFNMGATHFLGQGAGSEMIFLGQPCTAPRWKLFCRSSESNEFSWPVTVSRDTLPSWLSQMLSARTKAVNVMYVTVHLLFIVMIVAQKL